MRFHKYHALGNDYIVLDPADFPTWSTPSAGQIRQICHRHFGIGSDGILWGPLPATSPDHAAGLRIFNPDGSEAEKSGNGLRIFARYLWDRSYVTGDRFRVATLGGEVGIEVHPGAREFTVEMGQVSFLSTRIPVAGAAREVLAETITIDDRTFSFSAATIGNPHCVLPVAQTSAALAQQYGPALEVHPLFPQKTNVQFLEVIDRQTIAIEIWERGAGYTLASGSSSSAAAAVAHRLGWVDQDVDVRMPGGTIRIRIEPDYHIRMTGSVTPVANGELRPELFEVDC